MNQLCGGRSYCSATPIASGFALLRRRHQGITGSLKGRIYSGLWTDDELFGNYFSGSR